jgi:hypothetical protein
MIRLEFKLAPTLPVQSLTLGVVTNIDAKTISTVTDNPVESGSKFTDHSRKQNTKVRVQAYIPDSVSLEIGAGEFRNSGAPEISLDDAASVVQFLNRLRIEAVAVSLESRDLYLPSLLIAEVSAPRTKSNGLGYYVTLDFVELIVVQTATATVPRLRIASAKKNIGPVTTSKTDDATAGKARRSIFAILGDAAISSSL